MEAQAAIAGALEGQLLSFELERLLLAEFGLGAPLEQVGELLHLVVPPASQQEVIYIHDADGLKLAVLPLLEEHLVEVVLCVVDALHATHHFFKPCAELKLARICS